MTIVNSIPLILLLVSFVLRRNGKIITADVFDMLAMSLGYNLARRVYAKSGEVL